MIKTIQSGYLSARSSSVNSHQENIYSSQIHGTNTPKFPIKDFIKKNHAIGSNPISPNTDRTHDIRSSLRNSFHQTQKPNSNNGIYFHNQNSNVLLPKNLNVVNSRVTQNKLNFLNSCNENNSQRSYSGLVNLKNFKESQQINPIQKNSDNKENRNSASKIDASTLEILAKKIQKLTQRMNKNENQIEMLKFSEVAAMKKLTTQTVNFKQNKLVLNRKSNDQDKQLRRQIEQLKNKIKQVQEQLTKSLSKKEFQSKIQGFEYKIKQINSNKQLQKTISQIVQKEVEKQAKFIEQKFGQLFNQLCKKSGFNQSDRNCKNVSTLIKIRSNRFAEKAIQFKYSQKITIKQPQNTINYQNFAKYGHSRCNTGQVGQYNLSEVTYYIDIEGFLLDADKCYLVDKQQRPIKLGQNELATLKKIGILQK